MDSFQNRSAGSLQPERKKSHRVTVKKTNKTDTVTRRKFFQMFQRGGKTGGGPGIVRNTISYGERERASDRAPFFLLKTAVVDDSRPGRWREGDGLTEKNIIINVSR
ncbi:predicted protein [Histoplasma capsulatum H143]|uniref:Uncharacterized protein n=1 Tax=Ajellomyces capsulatus (strain H143) TaxID=544712 RepID=C6HDU2_AJECH|nr:predicted protein [Histoplasma capsulatum H143]